MTGASGSSGFGIGAVIAGPRFNVDVLVDFLRSQGSVRAISQPRIALMSGSKGSLRVGQSTTYVAKVGSNFNGNLTQLSVETQSLQTGFELTLFGEEHEGTVYTHINLSLADLVKFNRFTAVDTDLTLPQTAEREVKTTVRARPGDIVLLGGIATQRDTLDVNNGVGATRKTGAVERSELVIALKPRIVRFAESGAAVTKPAAGLPAVLITPAGEPAAAKGVSAAPAAGVVAASPPGSNSPTGQAPVASAVTPVASVAPVERPATSVNSSAAGEAR
jgi:MSHA biogenesis protein MshL